MAPSRHSVLFKLAGKAIEMTNDDQNLVDAGKIRVLLVEDHVLTRIGLKTVLARTSDITVVGEADNGLDAIQKVEELKPDVVLMDVGMPVMDGIEAADQLRTSHPEVNIIMLTSHDNDQDIFASLAAGAGGYCLKDVLPERLYMAIRSVKAGDIWLDSAIASRVIRLYNNPKARNPQRVSGAQPAAQTGPGAQGDVSAPNVSDGATINDARSAGGFAFTPNKTLNAPAGDSSTVSKRAAQSQSISGSQQLVSGTSEINAGRDGSAGGAGVAGSNQTNLTEPLSPRELEVLALLVEGLSNQDIADRLIISLATAKTHVRNILNKMAVDDRTQAAVLAMRRGLV